LVARQLITIIFVSLISAESIQISVDKNKLEEGELLQLNIQVIDGEDFAKVDLGPLETDFEIVNGPSQQNNIQWTNGKMSSTKTLSWTLLPKKSGSLILPALSGTVGKKKFKGEKILIKVGKANDDSFTNVFISGEIDKANVHLGEQVTLTYKLYKKVGINIAGIDQFQMPDFKGFWTEDLFSPQRLQYKSKEVIKKGIRYQVAILGQRALFPIAADKHEIPPVKIKVQIEVEKKKRRRDPFFDPFFDSFLSETKTRILSTNIKKVKIIEYPKPRPNDFTGAVGAFDLSATIDRDTVKANEGLTLRILLEGTGNIGLFSLPEINLPEYLEVFPPTENFEKDAFRNQISGKQLWEYVLIPRKEGPLVIPGMKMSIFDSDKKAWKRIQTEPIKILVSPSDNIYPKGIGFQKKELELIGQDIRYFHTAESKLFDKRAKKYNIIFLTYLLSAIILSFPFLLSTFAGYRLSTADDRKSNNALRLSLKKLNNDSSNEPFELANKAFCQYLKDKLSLSSKNLDPILVKSILIDKVKKDTCKELVDLLIVCDQGRYSPQAVNKKDTVLSEMRVLLKKIDREMT
jgi:hypothetical protein